MARILIVDDDFDVRNVLVRMLESAGHEVSCTSDGNIALNLVKIRPVDLVITDIFMPNRDGIRTIIALRKEHKEVKILAISGGGGMGSVDYLGIARTAGAHRIMAKPIERAELLAAVDELVATGPATGRAPKGA